MTESESQYVCIEHRPVPFPEDKFYSPNLLPDKLCHCGKLAELEIAPKQSWSAPLKYPRL